MAARYIPPGRRNIGGARAQREANLATETTSSSATEPTMLSSSKSYPVGDICSYFGDENISHAGSTTPHASTALPDALAFILLFHGANPRWTSDHILFVKSNLDLLGSSTGPGGEDNTAPKLPESVAAFEQRKGSRMAKFEFTGWYKITHVQFLSPRTPDLVRMLEQKWTKKDRYGNVSQIEREGEAWMRSLSQRWAVVKFERDEVAEKEKGPPDIKTAPERSVNELLQEMRIKEAAVAGADSANLGSGSPGIASLTELDPNLPHTASKDGQSLAQEGSADQYAKDTGASDSNEGAATSEADN